MSWFVSETLHACSVRYGGPSILVASSGEETRKKGVQWGGVQLGWARTRRLRVLGRDVWMSEYILGTRLIASTSLSERAWSEHLVD